MPATIAVIPARSGSKRIPNKNIIDLKGKPMLAWTIEAAIQADLFDRVIVSTDSSEYAEIAKAYGASCDFLRTQAQDDLSPVSLATLHATSSATSFYQEQYQTVVQLMPNCPLRDFAHVRSAMTFFTNNNNSSCISGFKYGWQNPWWAHKIIDQNPVPLFEGATTTRSQDLPELYCPTGAIWISTIEKLRTHKTFYSPGWRFYILPWEAAVDIDDYDDLRLAQALL